MPTSELEYLKRIDANVQKLVDKFCPTIPTKNNKINFGVNVTNSFDHYKGETEIPRKVRLFYNKDKDLPKFKQPHEHDFVQELSKPQTSWSGTMLENNSRLKKLKGLFEEVTVSPVVIINTQGNFTSYPNKDWTWHELGRDLKYEKTVKNWLTAYMELNSEYTDVLEVGNEIWGWKKEHWNKYQDVFIKTYYILNRDKKNTKISSMALPIGQNIKSDLTLMDVANPNYQYDYINLHTYSFDTDGKWTLDFDTVKRDIDASLEHMNKYFQQGSAKPITKLRITECGYPNAFSKQFYKWLFEYCSQFNEVSDIFAYNFNQIKDGRFDDCYMIDPNTKQETDTYMWLLENFNQS